MSADRGSGSEPQGGGLHGLRPGDDSIHSLRPWLFGLEDRCHLLENRSSFFFFPLVVLKGIDFTGQIFSCFPGDLSKWRDGSVERRMSQIGGPGFFCFFWWGGAKRPERR